jgi:AcrR family transcriptional regulator
MAEAATARGRVRRERLLHATAELVADRGFHAVGIADIGAAAGVTGSAIYRHFPNKTQLLVAILDRLVDELLGAASRAGGVEELVGAHVEFALDNRAFIAVWSQEAHHLPADDRRRLRRKQRVYVERWADALEAERPGLGRDETRARVQAALGLLNSVSAFPYRLPRDDLAPLLRAMAAAALTATGLGNMTPAR